MSPLLTTRRALWWPGLAIVGAAVGIAASLGAWLGARSWPFEVAVIAAVLVCLRLGRRVRLRRAQTSTAPPPRRTRETLEVLQGGKRDYDLAKDDSTDSQRWLM